MFPIKNANATQQIAFATVALILVNVFVFVLVQDRSDDRVGVPNPDGEEVAIRAEDRFSLQYGAIPCELTERRALDFEDAQELLRGISDTCDTAEGPQLFPDKSIWFAVITSMFLHGSLLHLGLNMWFLWLFGNNIEDHVGPARYLSFYMVGGIVATAAHVLLQPDSTVPIIGASGAIAAIMGTSLVWFPRAPIRVLAITYWLRIRAIWLLLGWFLLQFFTDNDSQVPWAVHVGGFLFGVATGALVRQVRPLCRLVWREPWRSGAYYRWDLTGGYGDQGTYGRGRPRFGGRSW